MNPLREMTASRQPSQRAKDCKLPGRGLEPKQFSLSQSILGDHADASSYTRRVIPNGGIEHSPLLNRLLDAAWLRGEHRHFANACVSSGQDAWFRECQVPNASPSLRAPERKGMQRFVYQIFAKIETTADLSKELTSKLVVTFGEDFARNTRVRADWYQCLVKVLVHCKPHSKMCLFKTFIGGWTTSVRMHEPTTLGCLFGCKGEPDDLKHYLSCAPLWQITAELVGTQPPLNLAERLCIVNPSPDGVVRVALAFQCYHYTESLCTGEAPQLSVQDTRGLQQAALESGRSFLSHVN